MCPEAFDWGLTSGRPERVPATFAQRRYQTWLAINHAANRHLYGMYVTDFSHVQRMFTDAYARLVTMKLFTLRAADYMRSASRQDRR